jgi:hypothetical protein
LEPSPVPELPPEIETAIAKGIREEEVAQLEEAAAQGMEIDPEAFEQIFDEMSEEALKEIKRIAQIEAEELETEIDDELLEAKWYEALTETIYDIITYPTGFIEGPIFRRKEKLMWGQIDDQGYPVIGQEIVPEFNRRSPYDVYPAPGARNLNDGDLCLVERYTRSQLSDMRGVEGWDDEAINLVLDNFDSEMINIEGRVESERADLENRDREDATRKNMIECIRFIGSVQGKWLIEHGVPEHEIEDPLKEYHGVAILCGDVILSAKLNGNPLGRKNVYSASFIKSNDSVWGISVPESMSDIQEMCNGFARAIAANASIASGPMAWVNQEKLAPGVKITSLRPHQIFQTEFNEVEGTGKPIDFFQPQMNLSQLISAFDYFFKQASERTGIPSYIYGSEDATGAARTASGLSMLMNAASKVLQQVALNIDIGIIKPSVRDYWTQKMLSEPEIAKGDIGIIPRASGYLIQSEALDVRRQEFLNFTANPIDMEIIGKPGRATILRKIAKRLKLEDSIVPDQEDILQDTQAQEVRAEVENVIGALAKNMGVPPEQLMSMLETEPTQPDGSPMGGLQLMQ